MPFQACVAQLMRSDAFIDDAPPQARVAHEAPETVRADSQPQLVLCASQVVAAIRRD